MPFNSGHIGRSGIIGLPPQTLLQNQVLACYSPDYWNLLVVSIENCNFVNYCTVIDQMSLQGLKMIETGYLLSSPTLN